MTTIKITEDKKEMASIGKEIVLEKPEIYTERRVKIIKDKIDEMLPEASDEEREESFYSSIYNYWLYGNNIGEEFYMGFREMMHEDKLSYLTSRNRLVYMRYLNAPEDVHYLQNKYDAYMLLKKYYGRDVIEVKDENDFGIFSEFVKKHKEFVVKPSDLGLGVGVHKESIKDYKSLKILFSKILDEGKVNKQNFPWGEKSSVILEQLIEQDEALAKLHPSSVNGIRVTTVRVDDIVHIWYPEIKIGVNGSFIDNGGQGGILAGINKETGILETDGFDEKCCSYEVHPDTQIRIKGYQIPRWNELLDTVRQLSDLLPSVRYIGWDMALTSNGWICVEGNDCGEFVQQMLYKKGMKDEFEKLISWKPKSEIWWQNPPFL